MDEKLKDKNRESKVSMIGPLAAFLAAIITASADLPVELQYIMVSLLAVIATVSIYVVFGQQCVRLYQKTRIAIKNHFLASKYLSEFNLFINRLSELSQDNRCDNLPYAFTHLKNMPPEFNYPRSLMYDLANILTVFKECMKKFWERDFQLMIEWYESILRIYNRQLVLEPFRLMRNLDVDRLTEYDKEAYEKSREAYICFLQDYEKFARAMNKDSGEKIAQDYFDKPGRLWKS